MWEFPKANARNGYKKLLLIPFAYNGDMESDNKHWYATKELTNALKEVLPDYVLVTPFPVPVEDFNASGWIPFTLDL